MKDIPELTPKERARFWIGYNEILSGCWPWVGPESDDGYPVFYIHREGKTIKLRAHRVMYFLVYGEQPGETLDHTCRTKDCVNPAHLESVSDEENRRRQAARKASPSKQLSFPFDGEVEDGDSGDLPGEPEVSETKTPASGS